MEWAERAKEKEIIRKRISQDVTWVKVKNSMMTVNANAPLKNTHLYS